MSIVTDGWGSGPTTSGWGVDYGFFTVIGEIALRSYIETQLQLVSGIDTTFAVSGRLFMSDGTESTIRITDTLPSLISKEAVHVSRIALEIVLQSVLKEKLPN